MSCIFWMSFKKSGYYISTYLHPERLSSRLCFPPGPQSAGTQAIHIAGQVTQKGIPYISLIIIVAFRSGRPSHFSVIMKPFVLSLSPNSYDAASICIAGPNAKPKYKVFNPVVDYPAVRKIQLEPSVWDPEKWPESNSILAGNHHKDKGPESLLLFNAVTSKLYFFFLY